MFELTTLVINLLLMALYIMLVHPFLSITYRGSSKTSELVGYHKGVILRLAISWGWMVTIFAITLYTSSTYISIVITATLLYMYAITIRGIRHYRKHKKVVTEDTGDTVTDFPTPLTKRV